MPQDHFKDFVPGLSSPAHSIDVIVPDDAQDLTRATRAINVISSGLVRVTTTSGDVADVYIAAGIAFPVRATRVWATGTTASGIRGLS